MRRRSVICGLVLALACAVPAIARPAGDADVAALQVGLKARGLYGGTVDGAIGPATEAAIRRLQQRTGLAAGGALSLETRLALGVYGRRGPLGRRVLRLGTSGWDVASLQFLLAWQGFPSGKLDGRFGQQTDAALRKFQRRAGLPVDGRAGAETVRALRGPLPSSPLMLSPPASIPPTDGFGPRGNRFHSGIDYPLPAGARVLAAARGRVTHAGRLGGGWGIAVVVDHGQGVRTWYTHLSATRVRVGQTVGAAGLVGLVGATGRATGPHLHFEVRVRGAAIDPLTALA
jgi:murein DD-endopeptidase MepM/ murein hydrolase activator NlpD